MSFGGTTPLDARVRVRPRREDVGMLPLPVVLDEHPPRSGRR